MWIRKIIEGVATIIDGLCCKPRNNKQYSFLDRWVRGKKDQNEFQVKIKGKEPSEIDAIFKNNNKQRIRYDGNRWFMYLRTIEVKEIRAKHLLT